MVEVKRAAAPAGAGMRVTVNGKPAKALSRGAERRLARGRRHDAAEGAVMGADKAFETARRRLVRQHAIGAGAGGLVLLMAPGFAAYFKPQQLPFAAAFAAIGILLIAGLIAVFHPRDVRRLRARVEEQARLSAPPGTTIRADDAGLALGGALLAWEALSIEALDLTETSDEYGSTLRIERLTLSHAGRRIVLDRVMVRGGEALVAETWRRLHAIRAAVGAEG